MLQLDPVEAAVGAADLYRSLRKKGVTIRKPNDCLIAYYALFYDVSVLHNDVDFEQIAQHTQLRVVGTGMILCLRFSEKPLSLAPQTNDQTTSHEDRRFL